MIEYAVKTTDIAIFHKKFGKRYVVEIKQLFSSGMRFGERIEANCKVQMSYCKTAGKFYSNKTYFSLEIISVAFKAIY